MISETAVAGPSHRGIEFLVLFVLSASPTANYMCSTSYLGPGFLVPYLFCKTLPIVNTSNHMSSLQACVYMGYMACYEVQGIAGFKQTEKIIQRANVQESSQRV